MDRFAANSLRTLGIVVTSILVIVGCLGLLFLAWLIVMMGGLGGKAAITHPRAASSFYGAILAAIALVTIGVLIISKLAKGTVRGPARSGVLASTPVPAPAPAVGAIPLPASQSVPLQLSPLGRKSIGHLVLALAAQIAVNAITLFQFSFRAFVLHNWTLMLLPPFILSEAPFTILIYLLIKRPGRRAFTYLIALLAIPLLDALFNPVVRFSYLQVHIYQPMGLLLVISGLIYIVILVLAYKAIQQTGLRPKPSSVILVTVAAFFYFFFIREITPYLYSLWR